MLAFTIYEKCTFELLFNSGVSNMHCLTFRNLFLLIFINLFATSLSAQKISEYYDIKFQKLSTDNVLPSNIIAGVVQDKNGFMWIGTSNGLVRYDGVKSKLFQNVQSDSTSLPSNLIRSICINSKGIIWLATVNGIVSFDPSLEKFTDAHKQADLSKFRGYYNELYLDDQERLICYEHISKSFVIIDSHTSKFLAVFNEETLGKQVWIKGDKRFYFVDKNDFWIVVDNSQLLVINLKNNNISARVIKVKGKQNPSTTGNLNFIYKDKKGNIYCTDNGLYILPVNKKNTFDFEFINLQDGERNVPETEFQISSIIEDKEGMIWVSIVDQGLLKYNPKTKTTITYNSKSLNYQGIRSNDAYLLNDYLHNLWVVQKNGILQLYDFKTKEFSEFKHDPSNPKSCAPDLFVIGHLKRGNMIMDLSGNYWLPTQSDGLVFFSLKKAKFPVIKNLPNHPNSLSGNRIWGIYEDKGLLWVGVKNSGLNIVDMKTGSVYKYLSNSKPEFSELNTITDFLQISDNEYWLGSIALKRILFDAKTYSLKILDQFKPDDNDQTSLSSWVATDIFRDSRGDIWISTFDGLNLYLKPDKKHPNGSFRHYYKNDRNVTAIANNQCWHIMEDKKGRLWISTSDGLSCMNAERNKTTNYYHNPQSKLSLSSSNVKFTMQDSKGRMWIATEGGGLIQFIENENRFVDYNKSTGFPSDNIYAVFEDKSGNLWMSSTEGIIRFTPETNQSYAFTGDDGVQSKQFMAGVFFQNPVTGKIYLGGDNGINHFYPDSIKLSTFVPNIVFESLWIVNEEIGVSKEYNGNIILTKALSNTDKLILSYKQNIFSIEFAALDFSAAKAIRYSYMLEGANDNWTETTADNKTLNYTNLAPGNYKLKVKSTNADGVWCDNIKTLIIIVTPPWWESWWFRSIFVILLTTGIIAFIRFRIAYLKNQNEELENSVRKRTVELQQANATLSEKNEKIVEQATKLHEVDKQKLQFLTNISHEFRTPLTLILGPTEKLIDQENNLLTIDKPSLYKMIHRNALRLLRLVNQVLDISKVEAGEMNLQIAKGDLLKHIKPICDSFIYIADQKSISFNFKSNTDSIVVYFDADKVEKIIYNLLSNAFKFNRKGGQVDVSIEAVYNPTTKTEISDVIISVSDTGIGIPEEHIRHIFDRFYQVKNKVVKGTGIGLALTRDLITIHKGSIEVKSVLNQGTSFKIMLPVSKEIFSTEDIEIEPHDVTVDLLNMALAKDPELSNASLDQSTAVSGTQSKLPGILIVEDNFEMRKFLANELISEYSIMEASDGSKGIEIALKKIPDLIITDLMMPGIDGLTLCRTLKNDRHTSHIPIIILTAKGNEESRTEGYETGADSYIAKPFQISVLKARIINLLQIQKTIRQRFSSEIEIDPKDIVSNQADLNLLNRAIEIIEQNSKDENFNVEKLSRDLGIHRVQLSLKFLALTNENISDFIRITRLKKAAKLLLTGNLSISEVCYQVGFKHPAHFTRIFTKQFNITPSKYIEENSKKSLKQ